MTKTDIAALERQVEELKMEIDALRLAAEELQKKQSAAFAEYQELSRQQKEAFDAYDKLAKLSDDASRKASQTFDTFLTAQNLLTKAKYSLQENEEVLGDEFN